jgi:hypothetical protein
VSYFGRYSAASFRTLSQVAIDHVLLTIECPVAVARFGRVVSLIVRPTQEAAVNPVPIALYRTTAIPTLGTVLVACKDHVSDPAAVCIVRGATASDLGAATPITAVAAGGARSRVMCGSPVNNSAKNAGEDADMFVDGDIWVAPGEAILVKTDQTSVVATLRYNLEVHWEEWSAKFPTQGRRR